MKLTKREKQVLLRLAKDILNVRGDGIGSAYVCHVLGSKKELDLLEKYKAVYDADALAALGYESYKRGGYFGVHIMGLPNEARVLSLLFMAEMG